MRLQSNSLLRRMLRPACASAALLAILSGCERRNEDDPRDPRHERIQAERKEKAGHRAGKALSVEEGEPLPNPTESGRTPAVASKGSAQQIGASGDQTIFILAGLAQEHDRFKQQLKDMDARHGEFLPVQQEHAKQIKQITQVSVPKLEQQMAAQQNETAKLGQNHGALEQRVAALEEELRKLKQQRTIPPNDTTESVPIIEGDEPRAHALPSPHVNPKSSASPAAPVAPQATAEATPKKPVPGVPPGPASSPPQTVALAEPKRVSKFNPQQQAIRGKVRGIYERVITDFPGSVQAFDALMSLGAMAEEEEDWPVAIKTYERAATEFPNRQESVNARFHLGRVLAAAGKHTQAREAFLIIPDWNPNHPMATSALLQAGVALAKSGKLDAGIRELRHIEKTQPDSTFAQDAREAIVSLLYDGKRYDEAIACFPLVSDNARPARKLELQLLKAQAERRAKRYGESKDTLENIFKAQSSPEVRAAAKFEYADLMEEQSKTLDAARAFSDAAQEFPQNSRTPDARMKSAQHFLANELPETAAEQMQSLLKLAAEKPTEEKELIEPEAMFLLAKAQQNAGHLDASRKTLGDLRQKYPSNPRSLSVELEEARGMAERGAVKDATALLRNMIRNHPEAPQAAQAMLLLAELQERNTDRLQRAQAYSDLLKLTAGSDDLNMIELRRGLLLMELERAAEASAVFEKIANNEHAAPDVRLIARYQAAVALQQNGQLDAAIITYAQFIDTAATPPDPAPKNLPALVEDAKWKVSKLKWLKELTAPPVAPQQKAAPAPATPLAPIAPPPRTQAM